tara:strand:- start:8048 stop:9049 length:1002 start_codon:yes stop_codon:yes gene_type:complete
MTDTSQTTENRPLVTFALFAYNQEQYIREAVEGAFAQTYEPLEIILSDDCSSDRTYEIMQDMAAAYEGPHEVRVRRNMENVGVGSHVSKVLAESNGEYIAFAAGDDISVDDRIEYAINSLRKVTENEKNAINVSFLSALTLIDENGTSFGTVEVSKGWKKTFYTDTIHDIFSFNMSNLLNGSLSTSGPSRIIHRDVYTLFGDIGDDCFTEDIVYLFRTALVGNIMYSDKKTIRYRKHRNNLSAPANLYSKPFLGVERQLRADLETATTHKLISNQDKQRASEWIDANVAFRSFYKSKLDGQRPEVRDLLRILGAGHLSLRRKFGLFREYLGVR